MNPPLERKANAKGCSYNQFLKFAGFYPVWAVFVASGDPRVDQKTLEVWDLPELAFFQLSFS
jgi:hypothetical protein